MEKSPMKTSEEKKPALFLWLVCHISLIIFPLAVLISVLLTKLGMPEGAPTLIVAAISAILIIRWYSLLDYEVTQYVLTKSNDDD